MSIECAFFGFLTADAESRIAASSGKPWTRLRIGVGKDDAVQWVSVAVFGAAAAAAGQLKKSDRCYIEGTIKIEYWKSQGGADRHGLQVESLIEQKAS